VADRDQISAIGEAFVRGLRRILRDKLHGAYIYGAAAFPMTLPTGDIDFHVILKAELTEDERSALEELHRALAREFPPLGVDMDGYCILLADARCKSPPRSQIWSRATDTAWALHRERIRAGRHIVLHGPDPTSIYPPASWTEIESALYGELDYVERHLHEYPGYCIFNLCRLIYSFETGDVVISKAAASEWAQEALPEWRHHITLVTKSYRGQATAEDRDFVLAEVSRFYDFALLRIERASHGIASNGDEALSETTASGTRAAGGPC